MRLALVAMPWPRFDMPSPALGALTAVVARDAPKWRVQAHHAYVDVWAELRDAYEAIARDDRMGELVYAAHLYPERVEALERVFEAWVEADGWRSELIPNVLETFPRLLEVTRSHAERLAEELAGSFRAVGLTTSYCQLFPSLALARELRSRDPDVCIILGGMGVPYHIGPSVLRQYDWVDVVVQGEGEHRLLRLLAALEAGAGIAPSDGIIVGGALVGPAAGDDSTQLGILRDEVAELDSLPIPDYCDYAARALERRIAWEVPIEASRGCWWDRVKRTDDPLATCYFCSLNTSSYRHKSVERVVDELARLSDGHGKLKFRFLDNIIRAHGVEALAEQIQTLGKQLSFFYELRAQMHPRELLSLWEAGCDTVQIGIEGLSSAYLRRIGKGTTTIQNLQVMKTCYELGIYSGSNLLIEFPGATQNEVDETAECIRRFAVAYQPTEIAEFELYINNAVFRVPERFAVTNIRNADVFAEILPPDVHRALHLYWLDFDRGDERADWAPVRRAVDDWRALHRRLTLDDGTEWFLGDKPLAYRDGGSFLEITDRRKGLDVYTFEGILRDVYLACAGIESARALHRRFSGCLAPNELDEVLAAFVTNDLIFSERGSYLSLAVADRPDLAARRIRARLAQSAQDPDERERRDI